MEQAMTRAQARLAAGALILAAIIGGLLAGCVSVVQEPAIPMPARPPITFFLQQGNVCMSQDDADALSKFADELDAFSAARDRLLKD
jgi:hypothetical protein